MKRPLLIWGVVGSLLTAIAVLTWMCLPALRDWWLTEPRRMEHGDTVIVSRILASDSDEVFPRYHGPWQMLENGRLRLRMHFDQGRADGAIQGWDRNGELSLDARAIDGRLEGPSWALVRDGQCKMAGQWQAGQPVGRFTVTTVNGELLVDCRWERDLATVYKHGQIHLQYKKLHRESLNSLFETGMVAPLLHCLQYDFREAVGSTQRTSPPFILPDGDTRQVAHYWWGADRTKRAEGHYTHGRASGRWHFWHRNGKPAGELLYEDGKVISGTRHRMGGVQTDYRELTWANGQIQTVTYHRRDGSREVVQYQNGRPAGSLATEAPRKKKVSDPRDAFND